jgi:two-component system, sensor histidine kinase and response regulator
MRYSFLLLLLLLCAHPRSGYAQEGTLQLLEKKVASEVDPQKKLAAYLALAEYYDEQLPILEALPVIEKAMNLAKSENNALILAKLHRLYAQIYNEHYQSKFEFITAHYDSALRLLVEANHAPEQALEVAKEIARTLRSTGFKHWQGGKLLQSRVFFDSALRQAHRVYLKDSTDLRFVRVHGLIYNGSGAVHWGVGEYQQALDHYLKALPFFERIGSDYHRSLIYSNIGLIYHSWEQKKEALQYFRKALHYAKKGDNLNALAYAYSNLAKILEETGKYDSALVYYKNSAENYVKTNHLGGSGYNLNGLGSLYIKLGQPQLGLEAFEKAYAIAKSRESLYWQCRSAHNMAIARLALDQVGLALQSANLSLDLAKRENYVELLKDIYLTHSNIQETMGNYRLAHSYFRQHAALKDSLFTEEKFKQITRMKEEFEVEKTEKENELLRLDKALQQQNLKRVNLQKYGLMALLGLGAGFLVVVLINRQKIKQYSEKVLAQKEEITTQKEEIFDKKEELERSNEVKDLMLSILSHDMRSPLNTLEQLVNMLNNKIITVEEFRELIPNVANSLSQVSTLTDNLLHWVNSQMGGLKAEKEVFDLHQLLHEKFQLLEKNASDKQIAMHYHTKPGTFAWADPYMIEVVLRNLLSNAIKFSSQGGTIEIMAKAGDDTLEVSLTDTGRGMDEASLQRLFSSDHFTTMGTKQEKGSGLGFLICRLFVEKNGGKIEVESTPKVGSRFYFTLPSRPA